MKKLILLLMAMAAGVTACQKENLDVKDATQEEDTDRIDVAPLSFSSASELQNTVSRIREAQTLGFDTKSIIPTADFISFAETVMQEDDYDDRINAICSKAIGSILNPDGEVIFGDYMMKVGDFCILYSFKENDEIIEDLAATDPRSMELTPATSFITDISEEEMAGMYELKDAGGVYVYDAFHIIKEMPATPETKWYNPSGVTFKTDELRNGMFLTQTFTIPRSGDQKKTFSSNSKIANDTKIYNEVILNNKECGIKTKTMKKGALGIWNKFNCNITAAITDILIEEPGWDKINHPAGWIDITTTHYAGASYIIATKLTSGPMSPNISAATVEKECEAALTWGKQNGLNVTKVDGIRYIPINSPRLTAVRIKNDITSAEAAKIEKTFGLQPEGRFHTDRSSLGNIIVNSLGYDIISVAFYGYSEYNGEKLGSRLRYQK